MKDRQDLIGQLARRGCRRLLLLLLPLFLLLCLRLRTVVDFGLLEQQPSHLGQPEHCRLHRRR